MNRLLSKLRALAHQPPSSKRNTAILRLLMDTRTKLDWDVLQGYLSNHNLMTLDSIERLQLQRDAAHAQQAWHDTKTELEFVWIYGGRFPTGPIEDGKHAELPGFSMARHPVTNAQWATFLNATRYTPAPEHPNNTYYLYHWDGVSDPSAPDYNDAPSCPKALRDHPVVFISYTDALHYCAWAGLNLPTSLMWEKGARGTDGRLYPWGNRTPNLSLANISAKNTVPVGSYLKTRTAYGCQDTLGNVAEICHPNNASHPEQMPEQLPQTETITDWAPHHGSSFSHNPSHDMAIHKSHTLRIHSRNNWRGFRPIWTPIT